MFSVTSSIETKIEKFLFRDQKRQMVTAEFISYRNVGKDSDVIKLVSQLQEKTGREDGVFMILYAQRRIYTVDLRFDWHPQVPPYYKSLEDWWKMVQDGESEEDCYMFYINNCHNVIGTEWHAALEEAQTMWTPPEEGWDAFDSAEEVDTSMDPLGLEPNTRKKKKPADPN